MRSVTRSSRTIMLERAVFGFLLFLVVASPPVLMDHETYFESSEYDDDDSLERGKQSASESSANESECPFSCSSSEQPPVTHCLKRSDFCNGVRDCSNGKDENRKTCSFILNGYQNDSRRPEDNSINSVLSKCGRRWVEDDQGKIIGGWDSRIGAHPWQVGIRRKSGFLFCGGTIIDEYHVLTASHCFKKGLNQTKFEKDILIRVGDFDTQTLEKDEMDFEVQKLILHPEFNVGGNFHNDIALIRVAQIDGKGFRFSRLVQPVCLPKYDRSYPHQKECYVTGWGRTVEGNSRSAAKNLIVARIPVPSWSTCYRYLKAALKKSMFCGGKKQGGIDTCQGDSGGPLVCRENGGFTIEGVTSWGYGCGKPNQPGAYTTVSYFLNWIKENTEL